MTRLDLHVTRHFRLFVEAKSSLATDRARHFAGDFIDRSGPDRDSDFFHAAVQYTF